MRNPLLRFLILTAALLALYSYFLNQDRIFESYSKRDSSFAFKGLPSSKLENISFPVNTFSEERGCNGERRHSLPYVSGDTFRCIADVILDETTGINYLKAPYLNDIAAERPIVLFAKSDNSKNF